MSKHFIAAYGTLMSGFHNNHLLDGAVKLDDAVGAFHGTMVTQGFFPFFTVEEPDAKPVVEIYEIDDDTLENVDGLEGHPDWYKREQRTFILSNGEKVRAWIYIMPDPTSALVMKSELVPNGDWRAFTEKPS